jgi:hypothetical protein
MPIVNRDYYGAAQRGREDALQNEFRRTRNALGRGDLEMQQKFNALAGNPQATPDQYSRIGRSDVGNALTNQQITQQNQQKFDAQRLFTAAQYALQSDRPKELIASQFPEIAAMNPNFANETDDQVRMQMQDLLAKYGSQAGVGPAKPPPPIEQTAGPNGATILTRGDDWKVVEPQKPEATPYTFRAMRPDEIKSYGLPPGTAAQINERTGQINVLPGTSGGNITEGERTAANYYGRMQEAEKLLGDFKPTTFQYMAGKKAMEGGTVTASAANAVLDEKGQVFYQAAADWVRAKLRKESGAVISPEEMQQEIKTYFPMPGDSPKVIEQKKRARLQAQTGMQRMGGRASAEYTSQEAPPAKEVTATGPNGQKIVLRNGQWVPL